MTYQNLALHEMCLNKLQTGLQKSSAPKREEWRRAQNGRRCCQTNIIPWSRWLIRYSQRNTSSSWFLPTFMRYMAPWAAALSNTMIFVLVFNYGYAWCPIPLLSARDQPTHKAVPCHSGSSSTGRSVIPTKKISFWYEKALEVLNSTYIMTGHGWVLWAPYKNNSNRLTRQRCSH